MRPLRRLTGARSSGMARARDARRIAMAAIGIVTGTIETGFNGQLRTLSIRAAIEIRRNRSKPADLTPDYRLYSAGAEIRSEEHTSELPSLMRTTYADFCLK